MSFSSEVPSMCQVRSEAPYECISLTLSTVPWGWHYYVLLTYEENETQGSQVISPHSYIYISGGTWVRTRSPWLHVWTLNHNVLLSFLQESADLTGRKDSAISNAAETSKRMGQKCSHWIWLLVSYPQYWPWNGASEIQITLDQIKNGKWESKNTGIGWSLRRKIALGKSCLRLVITGNLDK